MGSVKKIYSSQSTEPEVRGRLVRKAGQGSLIEHTIGTDCELAATLSGELHLRDCCVQKRGNTVAIVAEWDTAYGQGMHRIFGNEFARFPRCANLREIKRQNIVHFTYFRGIDGRLPGEKARPETDSNTAKESAGLMEPMPGRAGAPVPAAGRSQIDYVRRLVDDLQQRHRKWKAIGIVGSDVYDKILLIRSSRSWSP